MKNSCFLLITAITALAQTPSSGIPMVHVSGQATIAAPPDQAKIVFYVTTTSSSMQDVASRSAAQTSKVLAALESLLGTNANIHSSRIGPGGSTFTMSVEATITDLTNLARVIDVGMQAGTTEVSSLTFRLQNDQSARTQALKLAAARAKSNADAITSGLGMRTGAVQNLQQLTDGASETVVHSPAPPRGSRRHFCLR